MMVMIVTVATAGAMLVVLVMMIVLMLVAMALVVVVIVLMLVAMALVVVVIVLVIVAMALVFVMIVIVIVAMALVIVMIVLVLVAMALVFVMIVLVLVIVAMALVFVMIVLVIVAMALVFVMIVLMLVAMTLVFVMLVLVAMTLVFVMIVLVIVAMTLVFMMIVIVVMVMMLVLLLELCNGSIKSILALHSLENILTVKLIPRCGYYNSLGVMLSDKLNGGVDLLILRILGMGKHDAGSVSDLIVIELTEILHIHLTLIGVGNCSEAIKLCIGSLDRLNSLDNVGELTYSAGLDNHSVGMELLEDLSESLREISNERATDATGIHLGDLDTCILKESSVNADFAELIFYENYLLTAVRFLNKLLYKRSLSRSEKS